jgi:hypothetical protein
MSRLANGHLDSAAAGAVGWEPATRTLPENERMRQ